jgi:hypothetical protein
MIKIKETATKRMREFKLDKRDEALILILKEILIGIKELKR